MYEPTAQQTPAPARGRKAVRKAQPSQQVKDAIVDLRQRYDSLKGSTERVNSEAHWQDIKEVCSPRTYDFVGRRTAGEKKMNKVYDPTGILANETLAAGLHGMATNPATKWFSLRMVGNRRRAANGQWVDLNETTEVQEYLAHVEEVMWQRLYQPGTNFTTALHEVYLDLGAFGTAVLFLGQRDDGGLLFECRPLAEILIDESADGRVDTVYRCSEYSVRQMMQMSRTQGWSVSDKVRDAYDNKQYDDKVKVIHAVYPRVERDWGKKDASNMPWASCYFEHEECHPLQESGFPEFPYLIVRWAKNSGELYGTSPGMTALPDVKMLQAMTLSLIKLTQKAADPPMWLKDDGAVGQTRTMPGGINYWRGNPNDGVMLQPVSLQGIQFLSEHIAKIKEQIARTFFADIMRMTDRANMTATEVVQRTAEQMRLLGPLIGRLEAEMLGPLIERTFGILTRMGLLPPAPESMQDEEFTVEYVSPIATAQKQQSAAGIVQAMQIVGSMYGPELGVQLAMKEADPRKVFRWAWDLFNNDPDLLADEEQLEAGDNMEQTQQALAVGQPAMDMMMKGARGVKDVASAHAQDGVDLGQLLANIQSVIAKDPKAQRQIKDMLRGQAPDMASAMAA